MELFSAEFFSALLAIVLIDLVLAGDNAIVIALAARNLPAHLQKRAIAWGTAGAIVVRGAMTLMVVWLLNIPGLMLAGGLLLVWIAYKLMLPEEKSRHGAGGSASASFWGAMKTIVVADGVMGLDNVLAIAGASHGSFLLVTLGLLISIPIVIWGSTLILRFVERYPAIIYLGAAVLAWTAVKMMLGEPLVKTYFEGRGDFAWVVYGLVVAAVLGLGYRRAREVEAENEAVQRFRASLQSREPIAAEVNLKGETDMVKILLPVDGSENSLKAVRQVIREYVQDPRMEIHLLNVQAPFSRHIARFLSRKDRVTYHREQGEKALRSTRALLDKWGVPYRCHVEIGDSAEAIAAFASRQEVDRIVIGTARKNSLLRLVESSVSNRVVELSAVPVEVVPGSSVTRFEKVGVPAGIALGLAYLLAE
ncbi:MAG: YjbE family putative metal transport protein [Betaproteobacteria bacterium]|nr:YjbE family putative metal transport protein [Betaproteobacteria bacterium]